MGSGRILSRFSRLILNKNAFRAPQVSDGVVIQRVAPGNHTLDLTSDFDRWCSALPLTLLISIFALGFSLRLNPLDSVDEYNHFLRVAQIGQGDWLGQRHGNLSGGQLPADLTPSRIRLDGNGSSIRRQSGRPQSGDFQFMHFPNTVLYSPVPYAPASVAYFLGRALNFNVTIVFFLCRLALGVSGIALLYLSLRIVPSRAARLWLTMLATSPGFSSRIAIVSADAITHGLAYLVFATALSLHFRWSKRLFWLSCLTVLGLGLCKSAYSWLALIYLVPCVRSSRSSGWPMFSIFLMFIAAFLPNGFWSWLQTSVYVPSFDHVDSIATLHQIQSHPIDALALMTLHLARTAPVIVYHLISSVTIEGRPLLGPTLSYLYFGIALLIANHGKKKEGIHFGTGTRIWSFVAIGLTAYSIALLNYVLQTPVGAGWIMGITGRIFHPAVPVVFFLLPNVRFNVRPTLENSRVVEGAWRAIALGIWIAISTVGLFRV